MTVGGVDAHEFGQDGVKFQAEIVETLAEDTVGGLGFGVCVGPGVDEGAD